MEEKVTYFSSENQAGSTPPMPETYLVSSILVLLFCCLPLGIVALIKSNSVEKFYLLGDYNGALKASQSAKNYIIWSVILGVIGIVLYFVFLAVAISSGRM